MTRLCTIPALAVLIIILFTGCATTRVSSRESLYNEQNQYPATDPEDIKIFQKKPEDIEFVEIGEITVENVRKWEEAEEILKLKAAEYGGDAVYIYRITEHFQRYSNPRVHFHFGYGHRFGYHHHSSHHPWHYHRRHHYPWYHHHRYHYPHRYRYHTGVGVGYGRDYYGSAYLTVTGIVIKFR